MGAHPDVLVIGGGIIGCACALRLAQRGRKVTVLERAAPGRAASWASAGIVDPGSLFRTDPLAELRRASYSEWPDFVLELLDQSGIDPEFRVDGGLDLISDDNQSAAAERECTASNSVASARLERLDCDAVEMLEPALAACPRGALLDPRVGQVRPPRLMRALIEACRHANIEFVSDFAADELQIAGERVTGVRCGSDVRSADVILLSAGAWSSLIARQFAARVEVHPVRGQILAFHSPTPPLQRVIQVGRRYLVPRADGLVVVGSTEEPEAGFEVATTPGGMDGLQQFARGLLPTLGPLAHAWAGLRPASRDGRPYLGPVPGVSGLFVATGHFRSGIVLAPITAKLLASAIDGDRGALERLNPFSAGR